MSLLYVTADRIDPHTGGGLVAYHQSEAFKTLGTPCHVWDRKVLDCYREEPWKWDEAALYGSQQQSKQGTPCPRLAHFYSGTFGKTVKYLKDGGAKVVYSLDPHDKGVSEREFRDLGFDFPFTHLTDEGLWHRYIDGYRAADVIVCSSTVGANTVRAYGDDFRSKRIEVIPHGCELPAAVAPLPKTFTVGYLGAVGPDKGLRYLFAAWKKLNYKDAVLLVAGKESTTPFAMHLWEKFGGGNARFLGWVPNASDFYNQISLYVQPSATEGFGLEVLEAMAHKRPVVCSSAAGARDVVQHMGQSFVSRNVDDLAGAIARMREEGKLEWYSDYNRNQARQFTWDKIRARYVALWKELLA